MIKFAPNIATDKPTQTKPYTMVMDQNDRMAGSVPVFNNDKSFAENLAESDNFGLSTLVDIVNPLQHIPVVSNFYQSMTGDTMGALANILGGALFGGPLGAVAGAGMAAYKMAKESYSEQGAGEYNLATAEKTDPANNRSGYKPYNT